MSKNETCCRTARPFERPYSVESFHVLVDLKRATKMPHTVQPPVLPSGPLFAKYFGSASTQPSAPREVSSTVSIIQYLESA